MLDTHIIDCVVCSRIGHEILAYEKSEMPPQPDLFADPEGFERWVDHRRALMPMPLRPDDYDHFIKKCCDDRGEFGGIKLIRAGSA